MPSDPPIPLPPTIDAAEEQLRRHVEARDRLLRRLTALGGALDASKEAASRDWASYNSLERTLRTAEQDVVRSEWAAAELQRKTPTDLSEEDYRAELRMAAEAMAEPHLRVLVDVWLCRHQMMAQPLDEALRARIPAVLPSVVEAA